MPFPQSHASIDLARHVPPPDAVSGNAVWRFLTLMNIDFCAPLGTFRQRYGKTYDADYDQSNIIVPATRAPLSHLFKPLCVTSSDDAVASLPPSQFWGVFFHEPLTPITSGGARPWPAVRGSSTVTPLGERIFDDTRSSFEALLGAGQIASVSNTMSVRWQSGDASVELTSWPRHLNTDFGVNTVHQREPRLADATTLRLSTGFSLMAQPEDIALALTCHPLESLRHAPVEWCDTSGAVPEREREFTRRLPDSDGAASRLRHVNVGCLSEDGSMLIIPRATSVLMIPRSRIHAVLVTRCLPARGPGYASIGIRCTTDFGRGALRMIELFWAPGSDDLTLAGAALAAELSCGYELGGYFTND